MALWRRDAKKREIACVVIPAVASSAIDSMGLDTVELLIELEKEFATRRHGLTRCDLAAGIIPVRAADCIEGQVPVSLWKLPSGLAGLVSLSAALWAVVVCLSETPGAVYCSCGTCRWIARNSLYGEAV